MVRGWEARRGILLLLPWILLACARDRATPLSGAEEHLAQATDALQSGDTVGYRDHLRAAVPLLPEGALDRPFHMYRLARAEALTGNPAEASRWLGVAWDEQIEGMMIAYALIDPAFDRVREESEVAAVLARMDSLTIDVDTIGPGVYRLDAAGPKLIVVAGQGGSILIDAGYAPAAPAIRRAVAAVGAPPVRFVINTHAHEDHVGGNAAFGSDAVIYAHPEAREAMRQVQPFADGVTVPARAGDALPGQTITQDTTMLLAGVTVRVIPLPAHTGGDLLVYLPASRILGMGDGFFPRTGRGLLFPGSEPEAFVARMQSVLDRLPDDTRVVSGHDPVVPVRELRDQFARTVSLVRQIRTAVDSGVAADSTVAALRQQGFRENWIRYLYRVMGGGNGS